MFSVLQLKNGFHSEQWIIISWFLWLFLIVQPEGMDLCRNQKGRNGSPSMVLSSTLLEF